MPQPLVSVLIPCYNCEQFVEEAVRSITEQTYQNLEILCINDGSTDNTKAILQRLAQEDKRIIYVENETNLKLIATLNKGLQLCQGKYIARMDADDISLPQRIEKQIHFMEKTPECGLVGTYIETFGASTSYLSRKMYRWKTETSALGIRAALYYGTTLCHPTVMIRKSVIDTHQLKYDSDRKYLHLEDYKFFYDICQVSQIRCLDEVLLLYRQSETQITKKHKVEMERLTRAFRREIINDFLQPFHQSVPDKINIKAIRKLSQIKQDPKIISYIKIVYYLGLERYSLSYFLYFFLSGDAFRFPFFKSLRVFLYFTLWKNSRTLFI